MIINNEIVHEMFVELEETRKISRLSFTEDQLRNWAHTLNMLTGVRYTATMLGDDLISEYEIPKALSDLVIPRKVGYDEGVEYVDLRGASYITYGNNLADHGMVGAELLDAIHFNRISKGIAMSRGKATADMEALNKLSVETTIEKVDKRLANLSAGYGEARVAPESENSVPIDFTINFRGEEFYTQLPVRVFLRWFADTLTSMTKGQQ